MDEDQDTGGKPASVAPAANQSMEVDMETDLQGATGHGASVAPGAMCSNGSRDTEATNPSDAKCEHAELEPNKVDESDDTMWEREDTGKGKGKGKGGDRGHELESNKVDESDDAMWEREDTGKGKGKGKGGDRGHRKNRGKKWENSFLCFNCWATTHTMDRCPHPLFCSKCGSDTHTAQVCDVAKGASGGIKIGQCFNCGAKDHGLKQCPHPLYCTFCGKFGHTFNVCFKKDPALKQQKLSQKAKETKETKENHEGATTEQNGEAPTEGATTEQNGEAPAAAEEPVQDLLGFARNNKSMDFMEQLRMLCESEDNQAPPPAAKAIKVAKQRPRWLKHVAKASANGTVATDGRAPVKASAPSEETSTSTSAAAEATAAGGAICPSVPSAGAAESSGLAQEPSNPWATGVWKPLCYNCKSDQHSVKQCPKPLFCTLCKSFGHTANRCKTCHNCGGRHLLSKCPKPIVCTHCGLAGHTANKCNQREKRKAEPESEDVRAAKKAKLDCTYAARIKGFAADCTDMDVQTLVKELGILPVGAEVYILAGQIRECIVLCAGEEARNAMVRALNQRLPAPVPLLVAQALGGPELNALYPAIEALMPMPKASADWKAPSKPLWEEMWQESVTQPDDSPKREEPSGGAADNVPEGPEAQKPLQAPLEPTGNAAENVPPGVQQSSANPFEPLAPGSAAEKQETVDETVPESNGDAPYW